MGVANWREALADAPFTRIPRWTPVRGASGDAAAIDLPIPEDVAVALRSGTVPAETVLVAAFAKVLATVTTEREVVFGHRWTDADPLPCRITALDGSWRMLLAQAERALAGYAELGPVSLAELRAELRDGAPLFEAVLDTASWTGPDPVAVPEVPVTVGFTRSAERNSVRVWYRANVLDQEQADRLAGYLLAALRWYVLDPDADHRGQSLLSVAELRLQLHGLAGADEPLPDKRFHELFASVAERNPDAVGLVADGREWTYQEIDRNANRIAHSLLARGLAAEDVVAVVADRSAYWLLSIIAIFKAGGVYLPLEPEFPADRIGRVLRRSGCRFAIAERDGIGNLTAALDTLDAPVRVLTVETALAEGEGHDEAPEVTVRPDQLAYVYFTSGSTGEPKGALCEHAGMLNHLLAKVRDLKIGPDDVVVQNAPQCFDISLWQLIAPLLAGARSVIIGQDAILDTGRFVDELVRNSASVLQLVPTYLELLLSDEPADLGRLRVVCVTGEAIKKELVQRWFDRCQIPLVNAYGATEASDDTTHEVMTATPVTDGVPLGGPIQNVHVYVLDERLNLAPLGSPGEIAFSGVCVGRGYANNPDASRHAFLRDPFQPDQRMYRTGDFGRWLPGGTLEFLGRRDEQVKIRGFRIELGEIEDRMLRMPGVRDAAVVVDREIDPTGTLVAFYAADRSVVAEAVRDVLADALPGYMLPAYLHRLDALPLTANGKIDKKSLTGLAATLGNAGAAYAAPNTPTERRIASAWAEVLQVSLDRVGREDHFFDSGGNSLSAVRLVVKLDREISLKDLASNPVLAELATVLDGLTDRSGDRLHSLSTAAQDADAAVVCFPYAGGNAVNFQPLAGALQGQGLAVFGVELPGHDLSREHESLRTSSEVADEITAEIERRIDRPVVLFGHAEGVSLALQVARRRRDKGLPVLAVVLAARLLPEIAELRAEIEQAKSLADNEVKALLSAQGAYVELDEASAERTDLTGAAYRHDVIDSAEFLLESRRHPPRPRLDVPLLVLLGDADPADAAGEWALFGEDVTVRVVPGGHYFPRTRPVETAEALARATRELAEQGSGS